VVTQADKYGAGAAAAVRAIAFLAQRGVGEQYVEPVPAAAPVSPAVSPAPVGLEAYERCPYCTVKNPVRAIYCQGCGAPV